MEVCIEGVSTRKVKDTTEVLCGASFSKNLVSSLAGSLESELKAWRMRRLEMKAYPYLFVDVRYEKVRVGGRVVRIFPNRGACLRLVTALAIGGMAERQTLSGSARARRAAPPRRAENRGGGAHGAAEEGRGSEEIT
jgi:hypothetical protein